MYLSQTCCQRYIYHNHHHKLNIYDDDKDDEYVEVERTIPPGYLASQFCPISLSGVINMMIMMMNMMIMMIYSIYYYDDDIEFSVPNSALSHYLAISLL